LTTLPLTNGAYGYPSRGDERRMAPRRLVCVHATYNTSTPLATARQERDYANRPGSNGPSAHSYLNRDGTWVHAIDPKYAAWSNGALRSPKIAVPGIPEVVALRAAGGNPNEDYYREIETCARYPDLPITAEQRQALAEQIARDSLTTGLAISRSTVHLHSDLDTEQRPHCPVPSKDAEAWVGDLIRAARESRLTMENEALQAELADALTRLDEARTDANDARRLWNIARNERDGYLAQRDEAIAWGKRLQAHGAAILATDAPEWVE
jgi:hypothetical protein